jgi:hypothetical protein
MEIKLIKLQGHVYEYLTPFKLMIFSLFFKVNLQNNLENGMNLETTNLRSLYLPHLWYAIYLICGI